MKYLNIKSQKHNLKISSTNTNTCLILNTFSQPLSELCSGPTWGLPAPPPPTRSPVAFISTSQLWHV